MLKIKIWLIIIWAAVLKTLKFLVILFLRLIYKIKLFPQFIGWPPQSLKDIIRILAAFVVTVYILGFIVFSIAIYQFKSDGKYSQISAKVFPIPAAVVGPQTLWVKDLFQQVQFLKNYSSRSGQNLPEKKDIYKQILDQMVENTLISLQAKKLNIKVSNTDLKAAWDKIYQEGGGKEEVEKVLSGLYGMSDKDFEQLLRAQILKDKIKNEVLVQIHARHILVSDENRAKELLDKVKKGDKFEDLAKEFSEDQNTKDNGGDLGWFEKGTLVPDFEKAAFALKPGEVAPDVVKTEFGFHIIKVEERRGTIDKSYQDWLNDAKKRTLILRLVK